MAGWWEGKQKLAKKTYPANQATRRHEELAKSNPKFHFFESNSPKTLRSVCKLVSCVWVGGGMRTTYTARFEPEPSGAPGEERWRKAEEAA